MTKHVPLVALTCAFVSWASVAHPQDVEKRAREQPGVEVTPYVSVGSFAASGIGAAARFPVRPNLSIELETGYRRAELNTLSPSVSVLFDLPAVRRITPYLAGGAGIDQYGIAVSSPEGGVVAQARTALAVNAGGGLRVPVNDTWGVRTDARWFNTFGRQAPERWRMYNGLTFRPKGR